MNMKRPLVIALFGLSGVWMVTAGLAVHWWRAAGAFRKQIDSWNSPVPIAPSSVPSLSAEELPPAAESRPIETADAAFSRERARLESRVQELEAAMAEKNAILGGLYRTQTNHAEPTPAPWRDRGAWLEDLKRDDPERYQEIVRRREEARQRVNDAFARKAAHFLENDTSGMTEEERRQHEHMLHLLDETWKLADHLRTDPPREERREVMRTMRENMVELQPMLDAERDKEFYRLGLDMGYAEGDALAFVDYLNEVLEVTSMRPVWEAMRPMGGFRPPRDEGAGR